MNAQGQIEYWLELAEYDLGIAKFLLDGGKYLYVGFMCQQVIEKALKAVISKTGVFPPKIHELPELAILADLIVSMDENQKQLLAKLTPLSIETRYPSDKEDVEQNLNEQVCNEYLTQTQEMLKWIKEKLQQ